MIAIIYDGKDTYVSPIFAIKDAGWSTQVIAFDADYCTVKRIHMWRPNRQVFIVEWTDFEHSKGAWQGYDWIVNDPKLLHFLRRGKRVSVDQYPKFKAFMHGIDLPEWFEIKTDADITSLMQLSLGFHDATIRQTTQTESDMELFLDTNWGCYITLRFVNVSESENIRCVKDIFDSEMKFESDGIRWDVSGTMAIQTQGAPSDKPLRDPYIKCQKVLWKIEVEKKLYKRYHRNYPSIEELYDDIKTAVPDALFEDGKIILLHATDRYEIASTPGGYCIYLNGKKERGVWEDQDIYYDALDFALPSDISHEEPYSAEPALWEFSPSKWRTLCHSFKYMCIAPAVFLLLGLILTLTGNLLWLGYFILFGGSAAFALLIGTIVILRQERMQYVITQTKIRIFYPALICEADFTNIKDIKLSRSIFDKTKGTIKFKVKKGLNANYQFAKIDNIDGVYDLLLSLWKKQS